MANYFADQTVEQFIEWLKRLTVEDLKHIDAETLETLKAMLQSLDRHLD